MIRIHYQVILKYTLNSYMSVFKGTVGRLPTASFSSLRSSSRYLGIWTQVRLGSVASMQKGISGRVVEQPTPTPFLSFALKPGSVLELNISPGKMTQWVKALASTSNNLSLILKRRDLPPANPLTFTHVLASAHKLTCTHNEHTNTHSHTPNKLMQLSNV